jgi:hypothetical protein
MAELGVDRWADDPLGVLRFQMSRDFCPRTRIYNLIRERSWGVLVQAPGQPRPVPSLFAVRKIKQTKWTKHAYAEPLRAKDIAKELELDKAVVSRTLAWLESRKAIRIDGKRIFPTPNPEIRGAEKLTPQSTFLQQDPIYQQLISFSSELTEKYREALEQALQPVKEAYLPKLKEVNTQLKRRERELRPGAAKTTQPEKVDSTVNFSEPSPTTSTKREANSGDNAPDEPQKKVDSTVNFSELSPIPRVDSTVNSKMAHPTAKKQLRSSPKTLKPFKRAGAGLDASHSGVAVGRSEGKAAADLPTRIKDAILETGIPAQVGDTPRPSLCQEGARLLADVPEAFWRPALQKRIETRKPAIVKHGLGLLRELISDVADSYRATLRNGRTHSDSDLDRRVREAQAFEQKQNREMARAILADLKSQPDEREWAEAILEGQTA